MSPADVWLRRLLEFAPSAALASSAVLFLPAAVEPHMLVKLTAMLVISCAVTAVWGVAVLRSGVARIPTAAAPLAAAALLVAMVVATFTSTSPATSLVGFYSRYSGLLSYLACGVLFLAALAATGRARAALGATSVVALGATAGYGLLQAAGLDPVDYGDTGLSASFAFHGNINFSSAWVAAVLPVAVTVVLLTSVSKVWRVTAGAAAVGGLAYLLVVSTVQGYLATAAGLTVAAAVSQTAPGGLLARSWRRHRLLLLGAAAAVIATAVTASVLARDLIARELRASLVERPDFWAAAAAMLRERPLLGFGLDTFAHHFLAYRPAEHALAYGVTTTDAPHSVPLGMFSGGGLVLGLAYVGFVVLVGVSVLRGTRSIGPRDRPVLAAAAGTWTAYQVQALVSFDVPPLAVLHWLAAGTIVGLVAPASWAVLRLPGRGDVGTPRGRSRQPVRAPSYVTPAVVVVCLLALTAVWLSLRPLRADLVAASAAPLTAQGRYAEAAEVLAEAADLNAAEASYVFLEARARQAAGDTDVVAVIGEAVRRDPGTVQYQLFAARNAAENGQADVAQQYFRMAGKTDPRDPPVLLEVAAYLLETDQAAEAAALAERAVRLRPDADALVLLAQARLTLDDVPAAEMAVRAALELEPENTGALGVQQALRARESSRG